MSKYKTIEVMELPAGVSQHLKAYADGFNTATQLDTGDEFLGAIPEADKFFEHGTVEHDMFCHGYVAGLRERFADGIVPCTFSLEQTQSFIL